MVQVNVHRDSNTRDQEITSLRRYYERTKCRLGTKDVRAASTRKLAELAWSAWTERRCHKDSGKKESRRTKTYSRTPTATCASWGVGPFERPGSCGSHPYGVYQRRRGTDGRMARGSLLSSELKELTFVQKKFLQAFSWKEESK